MLTRAGNARRRPTRERFKTLFSVHGRVFSASDERRSFYTLCTHGRSKTPKTRTSRCSSSSSSALNEIDDIYSVFYRFGVFYFIDRPRNRSNPRARRLRAYRSSYKRFSLRRTATFFPPRAPKTISGGRRRRVPVITRAIRFFLYTRKTRARVNNVPISRRRLGACSFFVFVPEDDAGNNRVRVLSSSASITHAHERPSVRARWGAARRKLHGPRTRARTTRGPAHAICSSTGTRPFRGQVRAATDRLRWRLAGKSWPSNYRYGRFRYIRVVFIHAPGRSRVTD